MLEIAQSWEQLFTVIQASGENKREEPTNEQKEEVVRIARNLKDAFQKNDRMIDELQVHETVNEQDVLQEHRNAVLGYRWAVNEMIVWKE